MIYHYKHTVSYDTSRTDWIVWIVGDPLQLGGGGEGVGDVSKVLQFLNIIKILHNPYQSLVLYSKKEKRKSPYF